MIGLKTFVPTLQKYVAINDLWPAWVFFFFLKIITRFYVNVLVLIILFLKTVINFIIFKKKKTPKRAINHLWPHILVV